jgi:hypothetical protein
MCSVGIVEIVTWPDIILSYEQPIHEGRAGRYQGVGCETGNEVEIRMRFRVTVSIGFVDGSCIDDIEFPVQASNEENARKQVTPEYIMTNVSDDWGPPIQHVTITKLEAYSHEGG